MSKIRESLENGSVTEALAWCNDNKKELRKLQVGRHYILVLPVDPHTANLRLPLQSNLEFLLRCQQYIELLRINTPSKSVEAITHAKKYIAPFQEQYPDEVREMAALLAHRPTDSSSRIQWAAGSSWFRGRSPSMNTPGVSSPPSCMAAKA